MLVQHGLDLGQATAFANLDSPLGRLGAGRGLGKLAKHDCWLLAEQLCVSWRRVHDSSPNENVPA
jgi:hypothetical protein